MERLCEKIVRGLAALCVGYLFVQGLFTICNIQQVNEKNYFVENNFFVQLLGILLFFLLCILLTQSTVWNFIGWHGEKIFGIIVLVMTVFMVWWVFQTCFWYYGDTEKVYMCAGELLEGRFTLWEPGGYAYTWPHQNGLILFVAALLHFFTLDQSFYIFHLTSVLFYSITIVGIFNCLKLLYSDKTLVNIQGIMLATYLPYAFMTMCMYGDIIGYGWAVLAIYSILKYIKNSKMLSLIVGGFFMALGICFKQNCMIVLVAIVILLISEILFRKGNYIKKIFLLALFVAIVIAGSKVPEVYIETISGIEINQGNSKMAHVAMGMQESDKAPGWYNCYNDQIFAENDYDHDKTQIAAKADLMKSLEKFYENPMYAWSFFNHKLASEWNNPTFECFHVQNSRGTSKELIPLIKSIINDGGKLNIILISMFDIMQSVILFGVLMYFIHGSDERLPQLLWGILFIGAFLFWTVWEAKPRYVLPYFLFLIPYAFIGYRKCIQKRKKKRFYITASVLVITIILTACMNNELIINSLKLDEDTETYYEYIHQYNQNFLNFRF